MYWIGLLMVFLSLFLFILGIGGLITHRRARLERRLEQYGKVFDEKKKEEQLQNALEENGAREAVEPQSKKGFWEHYSGKIEIELSKADILLHPREYLLMTAVVEMLLGLIFFMITRQVLMFIIGIFLGVAVVRFSIKRKKAKRLAKISDQLPDTITLISNGLKAGSSFFQASEMVARDMQPPISIEFQKLIRQVNLGMPIEEALTRLGRRTESRDMDLIITAILIQRQIGGNLAEVLDNITHVIRERVRLKREIKSKTSQSRMSGVVLVMLPPGLGLLIYMMSPQFMGELFSHVFGWIMLGFAAFMQIMGIIFIRKILNIDM